MSRAENPVERLLREPPINFRGGDSGNFHPDRIIGQNERLDTLSGIIDRYVATVYGHMGIDLVASRKKFRELIVNNAYGRIYPIPDSASDFTAVIDPEKATDPKYQNCIVLTEVDGKLSLPGGFNQVGEAMTQTAARKLAQKTGARTISDCVFIGEESKPNRDERENKMIISSCLSGLVNIKELKRDKVYIVPLFDENFDLNDKYFDLGVLTDVDGKTIHHKGLRADHGDIIKKLYEYWEHHSKVVENGQARHLSLADTLRKMSSTVPQKWFEGYQEYPERFEKEVVTGDSGGEYLKTPNILFVLEQATKLFREYGLDTPQQPAEERARRFVLECVKADLLPEFPQQAVTVDCILIRGDKLIVQKRKDGKLALPGSFYSPDPKVAKQKGTTITSFAQELVANKFSLDFRPTHYLGTVGGKVAMEALADKRYPRLSHIYAGYITDAFVPKPGPGLEKESEIIEIPIWKDKAKGIVSDEILYGFSNQGWAYSHHQEILLPLFIPTLQVLGKGRDLTAAQIIRR